MAKIPPRKRKTAARSLHNICQKLKLPFHKSQRQAAGKPKIAKD